MTLNVISADQASINQIGRLGENDHTVVQFDLSSYLDDYPNATATLLNLRPGDTLAYPVESAVVEDRTLSWTVQSADVAYAGIGRCELVLTQDSVIVKSVIYVTETLEALDGSGDPPSPWQSWLEQFQELVEAASSSAEAAAASAEDAAASAEQAAQYRTEIVYDGNNGLTITTNATM